jgi:hypothetical protein
MTKSGRLILAIAIAMACAACKTHLRASPSAGGSATVVQAPAAGRGEILALVPASDFMPSEQKQLARSEPLPGLQEPTQPLKGGYGEKKVVGTPSDISFDLATAFPLPDSAIKRSLIPSSFFSWKKSLYQRTGLKLAFSYQGVAQRASEVTSGKTNAGGGWVMLEGSWTLFNRNRDFKGSLVFSFDERHLYGDAANPSTFGTFNVGSLWPTDFAFLEWDLWNPTLFWEQWFRKDRLVVRAGILLGVSTLDFSRFKDSRTAFSGAPFTFPHHVMPFPGPGPGFTFEWWPRKDSPLYVVGTVNDMNTSSSAVDFSTAIDHGQFFYGLEVGTFWRRKPTDFDHLHLTLFYADAKATLPGIAPSKAGGGFKVAGEKQWGRWVGFGSYTFNTAEGGAFGATLSRQSITGGLAYMKPLGVRGQLALGVVWAQPIKGLGGLPVLADLDDQVGAEAYWKLLVAPDLWITPGLQVLVDPSLNPGADVVTVFQIKFRLFL